MIRPQAMIVESKTMRERWEKYCREFSLNCTTFLRGKSVLHFCLKKHSGLVISLTRSSLSFAKFLGGVDMWAQAFDCGRGDW